MNETTRKTAGTGSFYTSINALRKRRNKVSVSTMLDDFSPFYRENLVIDSQFDVRIFFKTDCENHLV